MTKGRMANEFAGPTSGDRVLRGAKAMGNGLSEKVEGIVMGD